MQLWEKQSIFAQNAALLLQQMRRLGYYPTLSEAYRTPEQAALNAKNGKGISHSLHTERLAIDINLLDAEGKYLTDKESYGKFSSYWKGLNPANRWGGDFQHLVDSNHFEMQNI